MFKNQIQEPIIRKSMKEQVFLDFDLKFNLRQTRINKPTIIYAVFSFNWKQVKINTNTKVYPTQWNHKRQIATISNGQTNLDNNNNRIVNDTIKKIGIVFEEQKHYLCENVEGLVIDNCSSGGRRLDLEMTRRSFPLGEATTTVHITMI